MKKLHCYFTPKYLCDWHLHCCWSAQSPRWPTIAMKAKVIQVLQQRSLRKENSIQIFPGTWANLRKCAEFQCHSTFEIVSLSTGIWQLNSEHTFACNIAVLAKKTRRLSDFMFYYSSHFIAFLAVISDVLATGNDCRSSLPPHFVWHQKATGILSLPFGVVTKILRFGIERLSTTWMQMQR